LKALYKKELAKSKTFKKGWTRSSREQGMIPREITKAERSETFQDYLKEEKS
jgi:hypothetical protein